MSRRVLLAVLLLTGWRGDHAKGQSAPPPVPHDAGIRLPPDPFGAARNEMVDRTIVARGITDKLVIAAMRLTPRHAFVPPAQRYEAYEDHAIPIGYDKTISQPFIVATMTQA